MRQRFLAHLLAVVCTLHLCGTAAFAQFDSATVLGFISDQSGAAIPGVTVTLTNPATGMSTTAVINATFRSGTNQFRGAAWEFNRNTTLNATGFFKPSSGVKPEMNRNQFGGVFGGPILRDRAFFFFNYEGFREVARQLTFASIPTMEQRQGNLGIPVRNALTGELYANGVVPQAAITDFAR